MLGNEDGGNGAAANGAAAGEGAVKDPRGRKSGASVDRNRTAHDTARHATKEAWIASSGLSKSLLQYGKRHNRPDDSEVKDGFASDWLLITAVKGGAGAQKASWETHEAAEDALDVMVTMSRGGSLTLHEMSKILAQAGRERANPAAKSRDSMRAITLVTSGEQFGVAFEDERKIRVRSEEERQEIKAKALMSPPKKSKKDDSSQASPQTESEEGTT